MFHGFSASVLCLAFLTLCTVPRIVPRPLFHPGRPGTASANSKLLSLPPDFHPVKTPAFADPHRRPKSRPHPSAMDTHNKRSRP